MGGGGEVKGAGLEKRMSFIIHLSSERKGYDMRSSFLTVYKEWREGMSLFCKGQLIANSFLGAFNSILFIRMAFVLICEAGEGVHGQMLAHEPAVSV